MGPSNRDEGKMGVGDIVFLVILVVILIFLIPFYSSIFNVLKLAVQFMVGADTYVGLLGSLLGFFMLFLGFKHRNSIIKIFGLLLMFIFILNPFYEYLGNRKHLQESLGKYTFQGLSVIQPDSCQLEEKVQMKMVDTWNTQFGSDLDIEGVQTSPLPKSDASWKEKLRCMPVETHYVYKISYKDAFDENRTILYDGKENFNAMLKVHSYEILYEKIGDYLKDIQGIGKFEYYFKISSQGKGLLILDRSSVVNENVIIPTPNKITLKNFYQDKRLALEIYFKNLKDKDKIYQLVNDLEEKSEYPFPIIIHYGNFSEYYLRGIWYPYSENELITRLIRSE